MSIAKLVNCELAKVLEHAEDFVRRAEEWRDDEAILLAYTAALVANFFNGRLKQARHCAELIAERYHPAEHGKLVHIYQHDPLVIARVYSGHIEWLLGRPSVARACCEEARRVADDLGHPFMIAFAHVLGVSDHWYEGDLAANLACTERGLKVAADYGYPMYQVLGPLWAASALVARGPAAAALDKLDRLITTRLPAEDRCIQMPLYKAMLAKEFGRAGQTERALAMLTSAEALMQRTGERWAAPEIYRIHAELLCSGPDRDEAAGMQLYRRSIDCARELEAVGWELRSTTGLARMLRDAGETGEARQMLAQVRDRFPRSETSSDLRQADQLLHELGASAPATAQLLP
jgi:predicted ATPase